MKRPASVLPLQAIQKLLNSIWGKWNIQAIVVASLGFQAILEFLAPLRKRSKRSSTHLIIWSVYLLADYFATFGIGLINSSADDDHLNSGSSRIAALWAPFLLLHLGGPHTITSFDIEDNNLWHRHLLTLIVQVFSVLLVFYRYQIYLHRHFLIPTGIVFITGISKYAERTRSLYLASLSHMRKSMLETSSKLRDRESKEKQPGELEIVYMGYMCYQFFKGFMVDHAFIHIEDKLSKVKALFLDLNPENAYKVLEVELNFMYDAMFTKMAAVQWMGSFGYGYRFVDQALLIAAALIFFFSHKHNANDLDIYVTYLLLGSAIFLDFVALVKLVCSEWTVAIMMEEKYNGERNWILGLLKRRGWIGRIMESINHITKWISWRQRRWSKKIRQCSLINLSLKRRWQWFDKTAKHLGIKERLDALLYTTTEEVDWGLLERVFDDVKKRAAATPQQLPETTGNTENGPQQQKQPETTGTTENGPLSTREVHKEYDNCVITWHVATEICYFTIHSEEAMDDPNKKMCRDISEYLVYFLAMEGKLTSTVPGNIGMRFRDICWEEVQDTREELKANWSTSALGTHHLLDHIKSIAMAKLIHLKHFFTPSCWRTRNSDICDRKHTSWEDEKREDACNRLLNAFTEKNEPTENPAADPHHHTKSILSEAVKLAKHLTSFCNNNPSRSNVGNFPSKLGCNNHKEHAADLENPQAGQEPNEDRCSEKEF